MPLTVAEALASGAPRVGIFFRLDFSPEPVRLWLGVGDVETAIDVTDGAGATYSGLGQILGLPALQQLINGAADRVEIGLSGVSDEALAMAAMEAGDVKGTPLLIGLGVFGTDWQLLDSPTWLRRLVVDYLSMNREDGPAGSIRTLSLSCRTIMTGRRRPGLSYFTDDEQQQRSSGDRFCEHVAKYSQEVVKAWPRF